jgi:hypothetical protein
VRPKMTSLFARDHATIARLIPWCERLRGLSLGDRVLRCGCRCGWTCDGDQNAVLVVLGKGLGLSPDQAVGLDLPELKPLEREAVTRVLGSSPYICVSFLPTSLSKHALLVRYLRPESPGGSALTSIFKPPS